MSLCRSPSLFVSLNGRNANTVFTSLWPVVALPSAFSIIANLHASPIGYALIMYISSRFCHFCLSMYLASSIFAQVLPSNVQYPFLAQFGDNIAGAPVSSNGGAGFTLVPSKNFPGTIMGGGTPTGFTTVVEFVTFSCILPPGATIQEIAIMTNGGGFPNRIYDLVATKQGSDISGNQLFVGSQPSKLYVDPGQGILFYTNLLSVTGTATCRATLTGYFTAETIATRVVIR
jgi:hypothetical protein